MVGRSRGASSPFAWSTVFYLLLIFIAPLAFINTASAQDEQKPLQEIHGDGEPPIDIICGNMVRSVTDFEVVIGIDLGTTYSYVEAIFTQLGL